MVIAMQLVHQVTAISLEMVLPAGLGYFADQAWGTEPWLVSVGAVLGFVMAMVHLLQLARRAGSRDDVGSHNSKS